MPDNPQIPFDYLGAKKAGYSDDEIQSFLKQKYNFDFDITSAKKSGYSDNDISSYIASYEPSKKKESLASVGSQIFGNGSVVGAAGMSQLKSSPQSLSNVSPEIIDDPLGNLINSYKQQQQKASEDYTKVSNEALSLGGLQGGGFARPQNLIDAKTKYEDATKQLNEATQNAYNKSFNTAKEARDYLQPIFDKNNGKLPEDNTTVKVAANRIQRQNEVENILSNSNSLEDATGKYFGYDFTKQSEAKQGKDLDTFLHLPEVQEAVSEKGGNLLHAYNVAKGTLPTTYPSYVANKVANKISQELEDKKLTSWFYSNPSEETVNKAIQSLKDKGDWTPSDEVVYQHSLQPQVQAGNTDKVIRTTDLMHNIGYGLYNAKEGIEGTGRDIINTLGGGFLDKNGNSIFQNLGLMEKEQDRTKRLQQQEYSQTQVIPSSFGRKLTAGGGQFLGFTVPMILGESAGIPAQANAVMMFEGINKDEGRQLYPDNPLKQNAYTLLTTTFDAALFPMLGTSKAAQSLKNVFKKDAVSTIEDLATNKISQSEAEQSLMNKFGNYLKEVPTQNFKTANALTAFQLFHNGVKSLVGGRNFDLEDNMKEAINNYGNNFLSGTFLSGISALKNFAGGESSIGKTLREKADNPDETMQKIQDNPDMVENLQQAIKINESLKNRTDLSETQKDKLMGEGMKEFALNKKLKELPNKNLQSDIKEQIEKSQLTQQAILTGKNPDEVKTDNEIKLQRLHEDNAADNKKFDDQKKEIDNQLNELDGRTPENRPKIKVLETKAQELQVNRKRTNEDYQRNIEKISQKQPEAPLTEQPTVSGKEEGSEIDNEFHKLDRTDMKYEIEDKIDKGEIENDTYDVAKFINSLFGRSDTKNINYTEYGSVYMKVERPDGTELKFRISDHPSKNVRDWDIDIRIDKDANETAENIVQQLYDGNSQPIYWDRKQSIPTQEVKGEQTNEEATQNTIQEKEEKPSNEELNKNIPTTEEGTGEPPKELTEETGNEKKTGIKNKISEQIRSELNLPKIELPKIGTDFERLNEGKKAVDSGKINPEEVVNKVLEGKGKIGMHPDESSAMQYYMHQLGRADDLLQKQLSLENLESGEREKLINQRQQLSDLLDRATEANQFSGTAWSATGHNRQILVDQSFNPSREKSFIKEAYGGEIPKDVKAKLDATIKERDEAIQERNKIEEQLRQLEAKLKIAEMKKGIGSNKTKTDYATKRKSLIDDLKKAKEEHEQWLKDNNVHTQGIGFTLTNKMIKIIGQLAKTYIDEGIDKLEDVINKVHDSVQDFLEGISKKDIRDAIALYESQKLETKAVGLEKKIEDKNISSESNKLRMKFQNNNAWVKANQKVSNAEHKIRKMKAEAMQSQKNMVQKAFMWGSKLIRGSILSGANVLYKLASAAAIGGAAKRIPEQAFGSLWSNIYRGIAKKAPIEGFPNVKAEIKFYKEFFNPARFVKNTWEIAKTHSSPLSKQMGENYYDDMAEITMPGKQKTIAGKVGKTALNVADRTLTLPLDIHQMIKDPVKRATFEASMQNAMAWGEKNGLDINDPLIRNSMEVAAYKRANYEIFQEKRWLSKKFNQWKNNLDKSGTLGSAAKTLVDFMLPVSTVPTNIAARVFSTSPLGFIRGNALAIDAYRKGIESLSNEQADAVIRQLKQGSLGTALWLIGWFGASHFGGMYSKFAPNKKRDEDVLKSDEMEVNGKMIPKAVQHALPLEVIQMAATMRHIYDNYKTNKGSSDFDALYHAGMGSIGAMLEQIPVVETPVHLANAASDPYEANKLKEDMQRRFEPQILKETGVIGKKKGSLEMLQDKYADSDSKFKNDLKAYDSKGKPREISTEEFKNYKKVRDDEIKKGIADSYNNGVMVAENGKVVTKKWDDLTDEQQRDEITRIKAEATRKVNKKLLGEKQLTPKEMQGEELLKAKREINEIHNQ